MSLVILYDEIDEVVQYARMYIDINTLEYRKVWYKLFTCPDASNWCKRTLVSRTMMMTYSQKNSSP